MPAHWVYYVDVCPDPCLAVDVVEASVAKLALAVGEERRLGPGRVSFTITQRAGQLAHKTFGQTMIVYRRSSDLLSFVGVGEVSALGFEAPGFDRLELANYRSFRVPVVSTDPNELRDPGARRSLSLEDARHDEILREGLRDIDEDALVFMHADEDGLQAYLKVHDRVLQRWRHSCVFTGVQFAPSEHRPHPDLNVTAIRPRELGGPLHVRNYLPMLPEVERAWIAGHITLGSSFGFLVSERLIDPELHERLLPLGRLDVPEDPQRWPDFELVAWHRNNVFDRN